MESDSTQSIGGTRDNSALCRACGLCCNGVLHGEVRVEPEHLALVTTLGLTIEDLGDHASGFRQPCVLYQRDQCSVYADRPPACRAYRCGLLRRLESGDASITDCLAIVRQAKELLTGDVDPQHLTGDPSVRLRGDLAHALNGEQGLRGSGALREANAALALRAATLDVLLRRHFGFTR